MRKLMVGLLCFSFMLMGIYTEKINVSADEIYNETDFSIAYTEQDIATGFADYAETKYVCSGKTREKQSNAVGTVIDANTNLPISGASVKVGEYELITDKDGRFQIVGLDDGQYRFEINKKGYKKAVYKNYPIAVISSTDIFTFEIAEDKYIQQDYMERFFQDTDGANEEILKIEGEKEESINTRASITLSDFSVKLKNGQIRYPYRNVYLRYVVSSETYNPEYYEKLGMTEAQILEFYKAQAVVARTRLEYAARVYSSHSDCTVCAASHCQNYNTDYVSGLAIQAVGATETNTTAEIVLYNGGVTAGLYFSSCNGKTKNNKDVNGFDYPYLVSVLCPYDIASGAGGHGVGMCQQGAAGYAKKGWNYKTILHHYYSNAVVTTVNQVYTYE